MKRRSKIIGAFAILTFLPAAVFLQATLLANSLPGQVTPNLAFLLVVAAGYLWGAAGGASAGMWGGALLGAAAGSLAAPLACLYGVMGWIAGCHAERKPARWTLPIVTLCLAIISVSGETMFLESQPSVWSKLCTIFWTGLGGLLFITPSRSEKDKTP